MAQRESLYKEMAETMQGNAGASQQKKSKTGAYSRARQALLNKQKVVQSQRNP